MERGWPKAREQLNYPAGCWSEEHHWPPTSFYVFIFYILHWSEFDWKYTSKCWCINKSWGGLAVTAPWWTCLIPLPGSRPGDNRRPIPPTSFRRSSGSTLSCSPTVETNFSRLCSRSHFFGHCPQLLAISESWNVDWAPRLPAQLFSPQQTCIQTTGALPLSTCQSTAPFSPHSWPRTWDTWTPPLGATSLLLSL